MSEGLEITRETSLVDCAFKVCTLLQNHGKTIVLTGGSAATVYSEEAYMSRDIDFVIMFASDSAKENEGLQKLGYKPGSIYIHESNPCSIDFIRGDLMVGEKYIKTWHTLKKGDWVLHILSPTDCVLDRLASAIHWNDYSAIKQAALVAARQPVDFQEVERWCKSEDRMNGPQVYIDFRKFLDTLI